MVVWGLGWGLPHTLAHPDETKFVSTALGFGYGDLNPHWFGYPSLFFYLSAAAFGALYAAGRLTGDFPTLFAFKLQFFLDPSPFYLATRSLSALAGIATIVVTYRLGKELAGRAAGLVAALLVAANPLHARSSHFGNTDVTMTAFTAAALLFALRAARRGRTRDFVLAGLGLGLAVSTKYPAAFFAAALPLVALAPGPRGPGPRCWCGPSGGRPRVPGRVPRPPLHPVLLAAIVAAGAAVRVWGLGWGLPHTLAHPDETKFVSTALGFGYGDLNPDWFGYSSLFFYLYAAGFGLV